MHPLVIQAEFHTAGFFSRTRENSRCSAKSGCCGAARGPSHMQEILGNRESPHKRPLPFVRHMHGENIGWPWSVRSAPSLTKPLLTGVPICLAGPAPGQGTASQVNPARSANRNRDSVSERPAERGFDRKFLFARARHSHQHNFAGREAMRPLHLAGCGAHLMPANQQHLCARGACISSGPTNVPSTRRSSLATSPCSLTRAG